MRLIEILEGFNKFLCKLVSMLLCAFMLSILGSKMMIKFVKNYEGVFKFFMVHNMDSLSLGDITPNFTAMPLRHSNLQKWNSNTIIMAKRIQSLISLFHKNQTHNFSLKQIFSIKHKRAPCKLILLKIFHNSS